MNPSRNADQPAPRRRPRWGRSAGRSRRGQIGLNLLIGARLHVDPPVDAERLDALPGPGVERDQEVARRHVDDARADPVPARPVGETASRELPGRGRPAGAFVLAVHPQQLAGGGVDRNDGATVPARGVDHAVHLERRAFQLVFGMIAQIVRLEAPGHLQVAEIGGVDLVQRPVPAPGKSAV